MNLAHRKSNNIAKFLTPASLALAKVCVAERQRHTVDKKAACVIKNKPH